jgi:DNA-binding FadR family transcriptional regulator
VLPASSHIARSGGVYRGRGPRAAVLVADYLRQQIVEANIQDGDDLPSEAVLMKQFDVSRPTLREALRVLESEGLLTVRRGSLGGFRVHAPNPRVAAQFAGRVLQHRGATLADIQQVRLMLEPQCAKLVAQHRTKSDLKRLKRCLKAGADQIDSTDGAPPGHYRAFHQLIVELSGNQTLILVSSMLRHIVHDHASSPDESESTLDSRIGDIDKQHQQLFEFIDAKDAEEAEQLWIRHLRDGSNVCT